MSKTDLERLAADLRQSPSLLALLSASGEPVQWARDHGYDLTQDEVAELMASNRELSDDELEQAAGGEDGWGGGTGGSTTGGSGGG